MSSPSPNFDPVLGGQPANQLTPGLDSIEKIIQSFQEGDQQAKTLALKAAIRYRKEGVDFVIQTMQNDLNWEIQFTAWEALLCSGDPKLVEVAMDYKIHYRQEKQFIYKLFIDKIRDFRWIDISWENLSDKNISASVIFQGLDLGELMRINLSGANLSYANLASTRFC